MPNNPSCPHCGGNTRKHGKTKAGFQRYRCASCKKSFTDSPNPWGSLPIKDRPMTGAERAKRYREKHKP